jgi:selenocysteine lyase/cysteine desulfurase
MHLPAHAVTIQFVDVGEFIYHPVSEAEVRELLGRLPPGCLAGVSAIRFELGKEHQEDWYRRLATARCFVRCFLDCTS